ncbi:MAG: putative nuclease of putative toxin-antitoxin system [Lentimonas sp.]|jgi:predicted nuclease of predicted toxin-antitoxin system
MKIWLDAHLSPAIAKFLNEEFLNEKFLVEAVSLRSLGLRDSDDETIFMKAREADVVFFTKDADFVELLERFGNPPKVVWLRVGNTSNQEMKRILLASFKNITSLLGSGDDLVEVRDPI